MSFIGDFFGFGGDDSAEDAARIQSQSALQAAQIGAQGSQLGIEELQRQFDITQGNLQPFIDLGTRKIPSVIKGSNIAGFDERIGRLRDTDIFGELSAERERAVQGQLSAGGLTRSGTAVNEIANVPTELLLGLENLIFGRQQNLVASGQNAVTGLGALGAQTSGGIADLFGQQAGAEALGVTQAGQATSSGILAGQQANQQANQNVLNTAATVASIFFSDPRLKENKEIIGQICDLDLYQWDWIKGAANTIISKCMTIGFMSTDVKAKYPHHVKQYCGFDVINLPALLDELQDGLQRVH